MIKNRERIEAIIASHFDRHELAHIVGLEEAWPHRIALGKPTKAELSSHVADISHITGELSSWAHGNPIELEYATRQSGGAMHRIPNHAVVKTIDDAASLCGRAALSRLSQHRDRLVKLTERFQPSKSSTLQVLKSTQSWNETDFDLLVAAACWFRDNDATGLTPRQVPLPGFSAKWLDQTGRRKLVQMLCERDIALVDRAAIVEFAYLDPTYLASGSRRYDSHVLEDAFTLPYDPSVVIVVENKDTYRAFPPVHAGICLFGAGKAGVASIPRIPWVCNASRLLYWGDIDADGYEILDAYRAAGLPVESVLMDAETYRAYERFGTNMSTGNTPLSAREEKPLAHLTDSERAVYRLITSPDCEGHRRIEQERIPFSALPAFAYEVGHSGDGQASSLMPHCPCSAGIHLTRSANRPA